MAPARPPGELAVDLGLGGRHILVAGASRGLGFAITALLLSEGARVTAVSRDPEALRLARSRWLASDSQHSVRTLAKDLSNPASVASLASFAANDGVLDGVVVVAGSGRPTGQPLPQAFASASASNVLPALVALEATGPLLRESSIGAVVLVSSIAGIEYIDCPPEYAAAKASLHAYCAHLSRQLKPVRVNVLAPGNMLTEGSVWERRMNEDSKAWEAHLSREVTLGRLGQPDEVARVAVFLVSPAASFMTGSTTVADGGQVRQW